MELQQFKNELAHIINTFQLDNSRPFVCKGSPLDCTIFIIGINPATESDISFWNYWDDATGFKYDIWLEDYKQARKDRNKRALSNTRRSLNIISEALAKENIKILETNLYTKPTARAKELQNIDKNTEVLDFLIQTIKPELLVIHGNDVIKAMGIKIGKDLNKEDFVEVNIYNIKLKILPIQHLSYQFSKEKAENLSQTIIEHLRSL